MGPSSRLVAGGVLGTRIVRLTPVFMPQAATISDLGTKITTLAAAGTARLALDAMDPTTSMPTGSSLAITGNLSTAAVGNVAATLSATLSLQPG